MSLDVDPARLGSLGADAATGEMSGRDFHVRSLHHLPSFSVRYPCCTCRSGSSDRAVTSSLLMACRSNRIRNRRTRGKLFHPTLLQFHSKCLIVAHPKYDRNSAIKESVIQILDDYTVDRFVQLGVDRNDIFSKRSNCLGSMVFDSGSIETKSTSSARFLRDEKSSIREFIRSIFGRSDYLADASGPAPKAGLNRFGTCFIAASRDEEQHSQRCSSPLNARQ